MRMRLMVCVAGAVLLAACGQGGHKGAPAASSTAQATDADGTSSTEVPGAEALIKALNARTGAPGGASPEVASFFATDIANAMAHDGSPGEVGAIDFDYRWNAQDTEISDVAYLAEATDADKAVVTVTFKNFDDQGATFYDMCKRADGQWRILDVRSSEQPDGSVRHMLKLGPADAAKAC